MRAIYALMAVLVFSVILGAFPVYADMQDDVDQAATIIERFQAVPEKAIPQTVLKDARGLAIMTVIKAGFGISGRWRFGGGRGPHQEWVEWAVSHWHWWGRLWLADWC